MAATHGLNMYLSWNSVTLSSYSTSLSKSNEAETAEVQTMGDTWKERLAGLLDGSISGDGVFDATEDAAMIVGTTAAYEIRMNSAAVGASNPKWTGSAILTKYDVTGDTGSAVTASWELTFTGASTRATS